MSQQPIYGITNIPQDINLELNNGTLTLKSGSVVTFPDGTQYQLTADQSTTFTNAGVRAFALRVDNKQITQMGTLAEIVSGSTDSMAGQTYHCWYDTTNKVINRYTTDGSTPAYQCSLPICIVTCDGTQIVSIDKVFNGFGYIGSTLFVLPDVEGFYPNGKNGFNNIFTNVRHTVLTMVNVPANKTNYIMTFYANSNGYWGTGFEIVDKLPPFEDSVVDRRYYSKQDNFVYRNNGTTYIKENRVLYGYVSTASSSPYNITSFEVVNPFATITPHVVSDYSKYLANLLIIQYNSKPRAKATIESIGAMFPDELILAVRDGFNLETATGKQLDTLAKYIGAERGYTNSSNQKAVLTDEEFRILLKLKIIVNTGTGTLYGLETSLYDLFGTGIRVVEGKDAGGNPNMTLTYYIRSDWANIGLAAVQQNILPHPTGVGYTYNLAAITKYFGFIEYTDTSHPFTTGFMDYNDPTKQGEMFSYDKQIR